MEKIFSKKQLAALIIPLIVEQFLILLVGYVDSVMVASVGEAAVSGVSLVDNINILLINIFSAMATGGAVVISQYIGKQDKETAKLSAKQLIYTITVIATIIMALVLVFNKNILKLLFGYSEDKVMNNAVLYFYITALSYPFMALYDGGAAIFRAIGNSKISMKMSLLMNVLNAGGNAVFIFVFKWGVFGAAFSTLLSRIIGALIITRLACDNKNDVYIDKLFKIKINPVIVKTILKIGIPNGIENGIFQFGKITVISIVTTLGTTAIAANSVANSICNLACIPGVSCGLALITVVGQCVGAGDYEAAKFYTSYIVKCAQIMFFILNAVFMFTTPFMVKMFNLSDSAFLAAIDIVYLHNILSGFLWPLSFTFPNALRAAGDVKFTMTVSVTTMWIIRVLLSYIFVEFFNFGVQGVWYAVYFDWLVRITLFKLRYKGGKWKKLKVV